MRSIYRALRWSERYTKTDMVYLASGGFWSFVGQLVASFSTLAFAIAVSHLLTKDAYGTYKYILSIVAILGTFSLSGIGAAVFQSVARGYDGTLLEHFWTNLRWSTLVFFGAFGAAVYYYTAGNSTLAIGILLGGCLSPILTSANLSNAFLAAKKDFKRQVLYFDVIENLVSIALLIATIALTQNPAIIAAVYFGANTLTTLWLYKRVLHIYRLIPAKRDPGTLTYGKHLSAMNILSGIAGNIDQALLFHFVGPAQLAIYNFAIAIPDQAKGPMKMLDTMMQAQFVKRTDADFASSLWNKILWLFIGTLAFVVVYILLAPLIFAILFPAYMVAVPYTQVYALSLFTVVTYPIASYFAARKRVGVQYIGTIATSVIQIALMIIGVVIWGLWGLIIARIVTRISSNLLTYVLYWFSD